MIFSSRRFSHTGGWWSWKEKSRLIRRNKTHFLRQVKNRQTFISINSQIKGIERKTIFDFLIWYDAATVDSGPIVVNTYAMKMRMTRMRKVDASTISVLKLILYQNLFFNCESSSSTSYQINVSVCLSVYKVEIIF